MAMIIRKIENTMVVDVLAVIKCIQVSNNATKVIMISSACMPISIISLRCIVGWLLILLLLYAYIINFDKNISPNIMYLIFPKEI